MFDTTLIAAALVPAVLTLLVCWIVSKIVLKIVDTLLARSTRLDKALCGFVRSAVKIILLVLSCVIVADKLGIPTSSLVALVSIAGLALSLSVQNIMSNLFSGITLLITKPFKAGDYVDIGGKAGTVKSVGLFYTVIDTVDNREISIPNGDVTGSSVTNFSSEPLRRVDATYCVSYEDSTETVKSAIAAAILMDTKILNEPAPFVSILSYKESRIEYVVRVWCNSADYWDVYFGLNENIRKAFDEHKVHMTYDHINVHLDK